MNLGHSMRIEWPKRPAAAAHRATLQCAPWWRVDRWCVLPALRPRSVAAAGRFGREGGARSGHQTARGCCASRDGGRSLRPGDVARLFGALETAGAAKAGTLVPFWALVAFFTPRGRFCRRTTRGSAKLYQNYLRGTLPTSSHDLEPPAAWGESRCMNRHA